MDGSPRTPRSWMTHLGHRLPGSVERNLWNIELRLDALKFDIRRPDHLAPFFVFSRDEFSELGAAISSGTDCTENAGCTTRTYLKIAGRSRSAINVG
jgi:hypothetical protein